MTARTQVTLRVELDSQGDSISGRVLDEDGAGRSFSGWVGLAAAIEAVTAASAQHMDRAAHDPAAETARKGQEER